jgi:multiple sugar transport system substrate-binding protein
MTKKKSYSRREFLKMGSVTTGALLLASCTPQATPEAPPAQEPISEAPPPSPERVTLTQLYNPENDPYFQFVNTQMREDYQGLEFEIITVPYDQTLTKIVSMIAAGSQLDVITPDIIWIGQFAKQGFLLPLNDYLSREEIDSFLPGLMEGLASGGNQLAMPAGAWFKNLFYNKTIIDQMGMTEPPRTYKDLIEVGQEAQAAGLVRYPMGWGWSQAEGLTCDWTLLLHAFGGRWFDDNGQWVMNDDSAVEALTYMVDNVNNGVFDPASTTYNDRTVMNPFLVGDYFQMTSWGTWGWSVADDPSESQVVGQVDVGLLPGVAEAGTVSASCSGMSGISVTSSSKHAGVGVDFLKRFAGIGRPQNTRAALELGGMPPVQAWAWNDPELIGDIPVLPQIAEQSQYLFNRPSTSIDKYTEWSTLCQIEIGRALAKEKSPKEALDTVVSISQRDYPNVNV